MVFCSLLLALSLIWTLFTRGVSATTIPTENNTVVTKFTTATFNNHRGVSLSTDGVFALVAETYNHVIRHITLSTTIVTTLAGFSGSTGTTDGFGTTVRFNYPYGVSIAPTNDYALIADAFNQRIRHIVLATGQVTIFAGTAFGNLNGFGTSAKFGSVFGIAISPDGVYALFTDNSYSIIRKLMISTRQVTTFAGSATSGSANGIGTSAQFSDLYGIAISLDGTFALVAEIGNHLIRRIAITSGQVTTLAGTAQSPGSSNGIGTNVLFNGPNGVSISPGGDYALVADTDNYLIRLVVLSTGEVSTIAGVAGSSGSSNGQGTNVRFYSPRAVVISLDGYSAFVADSWNVYMRKLQFPTPPTTIPTISPSLLPTISPLPTTPPTFEPTKDPTTSPSSAPTVIPTFHPSSAPTFAPTTQPSSAPAINPSTSPSSEPSLVPTTTPSTTLPTSSPTLAPFFMRSVHCKSPLTSCSFVLCPNQEMVLTVQNDVSHDDAYLIDAKVTLLDSKENVIIDGYEFSYSYDVSIHFCDVMTIIQNCTLPEFCPQQVDISIFQSRDSPTLPKYSIGLVFNDTEHDSDPMGAPTTAYYLDATSNSSRPLSIGVNVTDLLHNDSPPSEGFLLVKWRTVSFDVLSHNYYYETWANSSSILETGALVGWVASEIHNSVVGFLLQRSDEMFHFYSLIEERSNTTESYLVLDHRGSYPNIHSYARGFSDKHYSFISIQ